jgi:hypothetical protein
MRFLTKTNRLLLLLVATLALHSCGVKQPDPAFLPQKTGNIFVNTNLNGVAITLNDRLQPELAPDTLKNIPVGRHVLKVFKDGFVTTEDSVIVDVQENQTADANFVFEAIVTTGKVVLISNPPGADIWLDGIPTGKVTPDTIVSDPRDHNFILDKNGFKPLQFVQEIIIDSEITVSKSLEVQPIILIETFGNTCCEPCVEAAEALHGFTEDNPDGAYAIIEYFAWWPSQNDPFYEESSAGVDERVIQTYLVGVLPTTKIAGLHLDDPASQSEIANTYSNALDAHTGLPGVSLRQQLADGRLEVELEIFNFDAGNFGVDDRLFVAVIENSIYYEAPNNLTDFDYVFRGFVAPVNGVALPSDQNGFTWQGSMNWGDWVYQNSRVIAFVQNMNTKHVLNATIN